LPARCEGFGLIEALVALALTAFASLSVALLLQNALHAQGVAERRERALLLADEMAGLIRANAAARARYAFDGSQAAPAQPACAATATCDANDLATSQLGDWLQRIAHELPAGVDGPATADISYLAAPAAPESIRIEVVWGEPGQEAPESLSSELLLPPLPVS